MEKTASFKAVSGSDGLSEGVADPLEKGFFLFLCRKSAVLVVDKLAQPLFLGTGLGKIDRIGRIDDEGGKAVLDIVVLDHLIDLSLEIPLDLETVLGIAEGDEFQGDSGIAEAIDPDVFRAVVDHRHRLSDLREFLGDDALDSFEVLVVGNIERHGHAVRSPGKIHAGIDGRVGDGFLVSDSVVDLHASQTDFRDLALETVDDADIPDIEVVIEDDEQTADDILDQGLASKTEDQSQNAKTGNDAGNIYAPKSQNDDASEDDEDVFHERTDERSDGLTLLCLAGKGENRGFYDVVDQKLEKNDDSGHDNLEAISLEKIGIGIRRPDGDYLGSACIQDLLIEIFLVRIDAKRNREGIDVEGHDG